MTDGVPRRSPTPPSTARQEGEKDAVDIDPAEEKKLLRKLDLILLPLFTAIYCLNFVDRVAGLEKDLGMHGFDLNIALTVFYIFVGAISSSPTNLSDIPSNLLLKHFGSNWLAFLVVAFGLVSVFSAFVTNYAGLIVTRVFLGLAEGGTLSALVAPSLAGGFGGLLASGLLRVKDFGIVRTWRKIFLIEGLATTLFGILLFFILPEDPTKSRMLNEQERKLALARIDANQVVKTQGKKEKTTWKLVWTSFKLHGRTLACTLCFIMINMSFQGLSLFLPSVINSLYYGLSLPYVVSAAWVILNANISARFKQALRANPIQPGVSVAGYAISVSTKNSNARYGACFLLLMGASVSGPMILTWATDNAAPDTMRAVVTAAIPGIGAIGSILAVWTFLPTDAPDYRKATLPTLLQCQPCVIVTIVAMEKGDRDHRLDGVSKEEEAQMGVRHPRFRYQI
ncbi:major facilitator superfamily domain-containing protein [Coprinopsis sp. MPI-PUGE-AT-0042]|nr:major facilitator superfamily domain-containing protein [Coprinopsis sp. MPI-PUGE-AT-0042]